MTAEEQVAADNANALDAIASCATRYVAIETPAGSAAGALVRRCAQVLARGTDPAGVLLAVARAEDAPALRERLAEALRAYGADPVLADGATIETAIDACARALDTPEARAFTNRAPHVLMGAEEQAFLARLEEAAAAKGIDPTALPHILVGIRHGWSLGAPRSMMLSTGHARVVHDCAEELLAAKGAMLAEEAGCLCSQYLSLRGDADGARRYTHVLADEAHALDASVWRCLQLLSREQLVMAGSADGESLSGPHRFAGFLDRVAPTGWFARFELGEGVSMI